MLHLHEASPIIFWYLLVFQSCNVLMSEVFSSSVSGMVGKTVDDGQPNFPDIRVADSTARNSIAQRGHRKPERVEFTKIPPHLWLAASYSVLQIVVKLH